MTSRTARTIFFGLFLAAPMLAFADVPFFFAAASLKMVAWWTMPITLAIDAVILRTLFAMRWPRAVGLSIVINAVSALAGMILYLPVGLIAYHIFAPIVRLLSSSISSAGFAGYAEAVLTFAGMAALDVVIKVFTLRFGFATRMSPIRVLAIAISAMFTVAMIFYAVNPVLFHRVSGREIAQVERSYGPEIAFMRRLLAEAPEHLKPGGIVLESEWEKSVKEQATSYRFNELYLGLPKGPVVIVWTTTREPDPTARTELGSLTITRLGRKHGSMSKYQIIIREKTPVGPMWVRGAFPAK